MLPSRPQCIYFGRHQITLLGDSGRGLAGAAVDSRTVGETRTRDLSIATL